MIPSLPTGKDQTGPSPSGLSFRPRGGNDGSGLAGPVVSLGSAAHEMNSHDFPKQTPAKVNERQGKRFPAEDPSIWTPSGNVRGLAEVIAERAPQMLYTIAVILIILWLLGLVTSYTMGGFIHILLVIAIVIILLRVISGRNPI